jgi:hypothetical protein
MIVDIVTRAEFAALEARVAKLEAPPVVVPPPIVVLPPTGESVKFHGQIVREPWVTTPDGFATPLADGLVKLTKNTANTGFSSWRGGVGLNLNLSHFRLRFSGMWPLQANGLLPKNKIMFLKTDQDRYQHFVGVYDEAGKLFPLIGLQFLGEPNRYRTLVGSIPLPIGGLCVTEWTLKADPNGTWTVSCSVDGVVCPSYWDSADRWREQFRPDIPGVDFGQPGAYRLRNLYVEPTEKQMGEWTLGPTTLAEVL